MPPEIFLSNILEEILDNPENIKIKKIVDELWVLLEIEVKKSDISSLIWKDWKTINSLKHLIRIYWFKRKERINLKIIEK